MGKNSHDLNQGVENTGFKPDDENVSQTTVEPGDVNVEVKGQKEKKGRIYSNKCCGATLVTVLIVIYAATVALLCVYFLVLRPRTCPKKAANQQKKGITTSEAVKNSKWGYTEVRPGANMFWWLWYAEDKTNYKKKPLILWIQGGPGEPGCGIAAFMEIGPYNERLEYRDTNWVKHANLLFVDSPVGVGYSHVKNDNLLTNSTEEIIDDLVTLLKWFLEKNTEFKTIPLHVVGVSYGGRIATLLAEAIDKEIQAKKLDCKLNGVVLGGPAIDIMTIFATWADYLYTTSIFQASQRDTLKDKVKELDTILATNGSEAAEKYTNSVLSSLVFSTKVDTYNLLAWTTFEERFGELTTFMNNPELKKLLNVPQNIKWTDLYMKVYHNEGPRKFFPVLDSVDNLLNKTYRVTIYNGQLDVVIPAIGTDAAINKLKWPELVEYRKALRTAIKINDKPVAYFKTYKYLTFYWILNAGHMAAHDAGAAMEKVIIDILQKAKA